MLDPAGTLFANTGITAKNTNKYETPVTGTLTLDTVSGAGMTSISSFAWFSHPIPATFQTMQLQTIGGTQILGNGLWNWGNNTDIPFSIVWDASGLLNGLAAMYADHGGSVGGYVISGTGVRGAADGTYVGLAGTHITSGYMDLGVVPMATTKWNTTPTCTAGGGNSGACMNVNPSGALPLVVDNAVNDYDYNTLFMGGDGSTDAGIAGSPMLAGPFEAYSISIDIVSLTTMIEVTPVPAPAAAWLFGSGLMGLFTMARRKR